MGTSRVAITHVVALVFRYILTCLWAKSYRHFGLEDFMWLKSAKISLKITRFHASTWYASVASRTTSSSRVRFRSSTDHQNNLLAGFLYCSCIFGVITMGASHLLGKLLLFHKIFFFLNPASLFLRVRWAWDLLLSYSKKRLCPQNVLISLGHDRTKFLPVWLMVPPMLRSPMDLSRGCYEQAFYTRSHHLLCASIIINASWTYHVTIKSCRFALSCRADWALRIGVARAGGQEAMAAAQISSISCCFVLR